MWTMSWPPIPSVDIATPWLYPISPAEAGYDIGGEDGVSLALHLIRTDSLSLTHAHTLMLL